MSHSYAQQIGSKAFQLRVLNKAIITCVLNYLISKDHIEIVLKLLCKIGNLEI